MSEPVCGELSPEDSEPEAPTAGQMDECGWCGKPGLLARCTVDGIAAYICGWCRGEDPAQTDPIDRREWV